MLIFVLQTLVQVTAFALVAIVVLVLYNQFALRALSRTRQVAPRERADAK